MPEAFFKDNPAASSNLGNVFFGLGALVTPALAEVLIRRAGFRRTMILLALFCLALTVVTILTPAGAFPSRATPEELPTQHADVGKILSDPVLWLTGLVFLLYGPLEGAMGTWATTYLTELGYREGRAALLLSGFWLTFLAARLMTAIWLQQGVLPEDSEPWVILVLALVAAVALGNLAGTHKRGSAGAGLLLVGAAFGPIFPTLVGILFKHFEPYQRGTAYGAMFAIGATGSLFLPPLIGAYARRTSVRKALRIPAVVALLLAAAVLLLALW
jgi:fucose permease